MSQSSAYGRPKADYGSDEGAPVKSVPLVPPIQRWLEWQLVGGS